MNFTRSSSETMTSFQATLVNAGYGQLALRDSLGKVSQKWTLSNPKCVLGTGANCNVRCLLPGITDHHVMLVIGAKQVFLRGLAPGLTRHGKNVVELIIPGDESEFSFEVAGHHFQYSRQALSTPVARQFVKESQPAPDATSVPATPDLPALPRSSSDQPTLAMQETPRASTVETPTTNERMKFTFVRALAKSRLLASHNDEMTSNPSSASEQRPAWVEAIVRDALRPVESRLDDMTGPIQNIERRLRRERARLRKAR
ncbi:MAG: hypothetical protein IT423_09745, partial [Pirellulaceae bacterium]|nr:hypothetical protein [Pirellulaceae bacterium]